MSAPPPMHPGTLFAGRYELTGIAGSGGMGVVWRAREQDTGEIVALKLALEDIAGATGLLEHESGILAAIDLPAIPHHVGHGVAEGGFRYLAMEWLEGEDLGARLGRGALDVDATLALGGAIAEALGALHAQGVVHCDLKPSNVFLVGGRPDAVKLMDFGIARRIAEGASGGGIVGTPFYMAPEQVRGEGVDGRADLYSLGCVLFECLTGQPPFVAESPIAVFAKALLEDAPAPSALRAGVPRDLDAVVSRLLAKERADRPPDASAVAQRLDAIRGASRRSPASLWPRPALGDDERRLASVVLASVAPAAGVARTAPPDATIAILATSSPPLAALYAIAAEHGALLEVLGDGSVAAVLAGAGSPMDLAAAAARCALALRALLPDVPVALVTGWEVFTGKQPLGRVIDRAAALLHERAGAAGRVLLDPMTAALLDERFVLSGGDAAPALAGERELAEEPRRLLGKPVAFVGREREVELLEEILDACVAEPAARPVLITGPPGVGKSRLRSELVRRVRATGDSVEIWIARGDPMRQNAPFGLLGQIVRRAARLADGEPIDLRRQKLAARVARHVDPSSQRRVAEFLGEIVGTAFPAEESLQLRAARSDPMLMADQLRRAWLDWLEAECSASPVIVALEDLQWGDRPTVDFFDAALRVLRDLPLMVLAVARPEVADVFPGLWGDRGVTALEVGPLPRRACEALVRQALGDDLPAARLDRIVTRSAQNPFLLEELVRAVDEGRGDEVPETVLAMVHSRLAGLDAASRRLLRAGSLFGEVFWRGAVAALLGDAPALDARLAALEQRDWIARRRDAKFHGEAEYAFRHGLLREAAYEMLTDDDRALGHRLAAGWLHDAGETDAMVLAEHFERGGEPARAALHYGAAAHQALEANDLEGAIARVERGIACGASGRVLGELCRVHAEASRWKGGFAEARSWAERALGMFEEGSEAWFTALREELASLVEADGQERILQMADLLDQLWEDPSRAGSAQVIATVWMAIRLYVLGLHERAETFHRRLVEVEERFSQDLVAYANIAMARSSREGIHVVDMSLCGEALRAAGERFERAGDLRSACHMRGNLGHVYNELGEYHENIAILEPLLKDSIRVGLSYIAAMAMSHLAKAYMAVGRLAEAESRAHDAVEAFAGQGDQRMAAVSRAYLAMILHRTGALDRAEREARLATSELASVSTLEPFALAVLASVLLGGGRAAEAIAPARRAAESAAAAEEGEAFIRLVHVDVLEALGDHAGAREAILLARDRVLERASRIASEERRRSFLDNVAENARTLDLARSWSRGEER